MSIFKRTGVWEEQLTQVETKQTRRDPEGHRQALIRATLDLIVEVGIAETTVSRIIDRARLSRGMIHLHFGGKDKLLIAAARDFSESYTAQMEAQLANMGGEAPTAIIMAVIRADLSEAILNERSAQLWHAFRGIANPPPEIVRYCGTRGGLTRERLGQAFTAMAEVDGAPNPGLLARDATFGTMALLEGMCVDYLSNRDRFSREAAFRIILRFVGGLFPRFFTAQEPEF